MYAHLKSVFGFDLTSKLVSNIEWREVTWGPSNRKLPRLVQSMYTDELISYVPELIEVVSYVQEYSKTLPNTKGIIQSVWMNLYRNGSDFTPYHKDSYNCKVVTVSFGSTRKFSIKDKLGKVTSFDLSNGDIFVFDEDFNSNHQHTITKTTKKVGPRVSIVFFVQ